MSTQGEFFGALVTGLLVIGGGVFIAGPGAKLTVRQNQWLSSHVSWLPSITDAHSLWVSRLVGSMFILIGVWIISLGF